MLAYLLAGVVLGTSAGFSPGPLLALVISQTFSHGIREGVKVSFAPLITDVPIIAISLFVLAQIANSDAVLAWISFVGGLFLVYLAYESFRSGRLDPHLQDSQPQSISKGAIVNFLNPHPYLFWLTVGAPMLVRLWNENPFNAVAFLVGFYLCLVGSKVLVAFLAAKSRQRLMGNAYVYLMRVLGGLLFIFALALFWEGLNLLGLLPA